jgi:hypothetical protein
MRIQCPFPKCTTIILSKGLLPSHYARAHPGQKVPAQYRPKVDPIKQALKKVKKLIPRYARRRRSSVATPAVAQAEKSWVKPEGAASSMRSIAQGLESKAGLLRQMADELDNLS